MHSYHHPMFIRGRPDLVKEMRRPQKANDESSLSSRTSLLPTGPQFQGTHGVPTFHMHRCGFPKVEDGTSATSSFEGEFHSTARGHNYGTMRDEPALDRSMLQEAQPKGWDPLRMVTSRTSALETTQVLPASFPVPEASSHIFGGSSGDESDEEFQKLLDSTDRLLGAALRAHHGSEDESPETSPLPMTGEEGSSMLQSFSFSTPSELPLLQHQPSTEYDDLSQIKKPLMPNL
jgi:hypothetical protein